MIERLVAIFVVFFVRPSVIYFERKMPGQRLVSPQSRPRHSFFSSAREAGLQGGGGGASAQAPPANGCSRSRDIKAVRDDVMASIQLSSPPGGRV